MADHVFQRFRLSLAGRIDGFVNAIQLRDGVRMLGGTPPHGLLNPPANDVHPELRAPIPDMVIGDDVVAEQTLHPRQAIAEQGRTNVADVHRFGDVRRAEIDDDGARRSGLLEKEMFAARRAGERLRDSLGLEPEIDKAGPGDIDLFAPLRHVEPGQHVCCELAWVQPARFGQRNERVGLVIAELGIRAWAQLHGRGVSVRQDGGDGGAQATFEFQMQHCREAATEGVIWEGDLRSAQARADRNFCARHPNEPPHPSPRPSPR